MKLPSHSLVIAYLALFVALGGSAYAVSQLPKNSVGTKQLKPNAVTAAKIKDGAVGTADLGNGVVTGAKIGANAVTGANVEEATLGRVPSAGSAEQAASADRAKSADSAATAANATNAEHANTAGTAANADALGGVPGSDFLRTNAVQFHNGALNACYKETLADVSGWFQITTVGNCQNEFKLTFTTVSSESWKFVYEAGSVTIPGESSASLNFADPYLDLFAISQIDPGKHALITCAYQGDTVPPRISCSTRVPPAA